MALSGILTSPSQRRHFLVTSTAVLMALIFAIVLISLLAPQTPMWDSLQSMLISFAASGVFAIVSGFYIYLFFVDPNEIALKSTVLPEDIGQALRAIASSAMDYKIFVRTGRHFRAEILPILVHRARETRIPIQLDVILLDFRDDEVCEKYATYRKVSSFDHNLWNKTYVQKEVLASIIELNKLAIENRGLLKIRLYLSKRLSTFRIEGSSSEILVTREDPKDMASRYVRSHRNFSAFATELNWVCDDSFSVSSDSSNLLPVILSDVFSEHAAIEELEGLASQAIGSQSPYAR